eukprot:g2498.t1
MSALVEKDLKGETGSGEIKDETGKACAPASAAGAAAGEASTVKTDEGCTLVAKWQGKTIELPELARSTTIGEVKEMLCERTRVLAKRQKLVGLSVGGRPAADDCPLERIRLKTPHRFILMGTPEAEIFVDPGEKDDLPEVFDDFDLDVSHASEAWRQAIENSDNLAKFTEKTELHFMNPPREGKALLVLDLDHTLLDFTTRETTSPEQMKRPHMDAFLTAVYEYYDLAIWSQTSWRWLELKLTELGFLSNPNYRICTVLDKTSMFGVTSTKKDGEQKRHHVKPLKIIWDKHPRWNASNTLHVDDLARNFALNPKNGVKVKAFRRRNGRLPTDDDELMLLARYLVLVARRKAEDGKGRGWEGLDHMDWKSELKRLG